MSREIIRLQRELGSLIEEYESELISTDDFIYELKEINNEFERILYE